MCHGGHRVGGRKDKTISEEEKERGDRAERVGGGMSEQFQFVIGGPDISRVFVQSGLAACPQLDGFYLCFQPRLRQYGLDDCGGDIAGSHQEPDQRVIIAEFGFQNQYFLILLVQTDSGLGGSSLLHNHLHLPLSPGLQSGLLALLRHLFCGLFVYCNFCT